ncbi:MAG: aminotransferase class V-fold PLP-dependent enzyme [Ignavibacteriae bacterium]|nr:MAG: aminotransferase class V-fold PLP-dependent enzyme [Ignavibacteriota bacterium]
MFADQFMLDIKHIREQFPITQKTFNVYGNDTPKNLIYFDHGASTHPPQPVLNKYIDFLKNYYANVHRGKHFLSLISSELFDNVYNTIFDFIKGDKELNSIILTSNTTTALDIAASVMRDYEGVTLVSLMEHHSNDLPHRCRSEVIHYGLNPDGSIDMDDLLLKLQSNKVKLVAVTGASNVTGFMPDIHMIAGMAHAHGAKILVDGAQLLAHRKIDVKPNSDDDHIDFIAAAGHKAYAPFGSAFLFGPKDIFDEAEPYIPGGGTVVYVTEDDVYYSDSPDRHQGGTPNIGGAIALAESLKFLSNVGMENIREHEVELTAYALKRLKEVQDLKVLGNIKAEQRLGVVSFNVGDLDNNLVSMVLNYESAIATRNGCFCAHPYLHELLELGDITELKAKLIRGEEVDMPGAVRLTIGIFNTAEEIDALIDALKIISLHQWKADYNQFYAAQICKEIAINLL